MRAFPVIVLLLALAMVSWATKESTPCETSITTPRLDEATVELAADFAGSASALESEDPADDPEPLATSDDRSDERIRVDVVLEISGVATGDVVPPVAELLAVDDDGSEAALDRVVPSGTHPALRAARGTSTAWPDRVVRSYTISASGRYRAAWHAWCRVPDTKTWRAVRGCGPVVDAASLRDGDRLVVRVDGTELVPAAELDRPVENANWTVTAKDG
ncbi:MAG: hypothetical protein KDB80_05190 [Planctomycetes bacterium]|nr:hypothetical protein [Planctomycetota bacterium]